MKGYQVLSPIRHKGKTMKEGIVFMPETEAAMLLASGHIMGPIDVTASARQDESADKHAAPVKAQRTTRAVKK